MGRTPGTGADRREQILEAAVRVFAEKGFARATNRDIARAAGITPGLIYHYFDSKEDLLRSAMEQRSALGLMRTMETEMPDLPPEAMLRTLIRRLLQIVENERFVNLMRLYLPEAIHNAGVAPVGISLVAEATSSLERYLERQMAEGTLRRADPAFATQYLLGGVMDLVLRRQVLKDPAVLRFSHEQIVDGILSTVLQGLLPR